MRRPATAIRTSVLVLLAALAGLAAVLAPSATASTYSASSYASRLLSLVNSARADHGLPALRLASGTTTVAAGWTAHLADSQVLAHNPDLRHQIETHGSPDWTTYGENVGQGGAGDPDGLFQAYMRSPEHRDNILTGDYRYVGVAVVFTGSTAWNTFDFVDTYGTPSTPRQPATHPHPAAVRHHIHVAQPQSRPAASPAPQPTAAPARTNHHAAARHAAARHAAARQAAKQQRARHRAQQTAARQLVLVRGLHSGHPRPIREVVAVAPGTASAMAPLPRDRSSRAALVAVAVLAFVAAARRWTLTVARV